jgi:hypothetical protein
MMAIGYATLGMTKCSKIVAMVTQAVNVLKDYEMYTSVALDYIS